MIPVYFDKKLVVQFLDAINNGKPIHCEWNGRNMLMLAGTLYAVVYSQGPQAREALGRPPMESLPSEHREAAEAEFGQDIHDATEFVAGAVFDILEDKYDQILEPEFQAILSRDGTAKIVRFHKGLKPQAP